MSVVGLGKIFWYVLPSITILATSLSITFVSLSPTPTLKEVSSFMIVGVATVSLPITSSSVIPFSMITQSEEVNGLTSVLANG